MENIRKFFKFNDKTTFKTEIFAGLTIFFTMAYIILINPKLLTLAGLPYHAAYSANLILAGLGCIFMGLYANKPYAVAPYLGDNAFIAYTLVVTIGYTWQEVFGTIFLSGLVLFVLTLTKFRRILINSVPNSLKLAYTIGLGVFLLISGLNQSNIVTIYSSNITSLRIGNLSVIQPWLAIAGLVVIFLLNRFKVNMAVIIGIVAMTIAGFLIGDVSLPTNFFSMPPSVKPIFCQLDFSNFFSQRIFSLFILMFLIINSDTIGSIITVALKAKQTFKNGNVKQVKKVMYVDSIATTVAPVVGTTTTGVYVDSITGIMSGGKTGLTVVVTGILFLSALFLAPLMNIFPVYAYAPAIMYVGLLLAIMIKDLEYKDWTEYVPALATIFVIVYSLNLGKGMAVAFILHPLLKLITGRYREISKPFLVLTGFSILYFILNVN